MKIEHKGHSVIIKDTQGDIKLFLQKVTQEMHSFSGVNLILDVSSDKGASVADIKLFAALSKQHRKLNKSFVMVADGIDFNAFSQNLTVVPSVLEAHDIIEMEEIERDLGF